MTDSIESPSTCERIIAKSIVKDSDDSTEPLSEEGEYAPQDLEDQDQASPSEDSGVRRQITERYSARGPQTKDSDGAKGQGSSHKTQDNKKPATTTKKTALARPPPSLKSNKYSNDSKQK